VLQLPPNVDVAKVSAAHDNGVLTITLPKLASSPATTTNIQIK
jgi:HSP20 family molecular chaperone IbpA